MKIKYETMEEKLKKLKQQYKNIKQVQKQKNQKKQQKLSSQEQCQNNLQHRKRNFGSQGEQLIEDACKWKWKQSNSEQKNPTSIKNMDELNTKIESQRDNLFNENSNQQGICEPSKPISPYMLFHIQKSSELKKKKLISMAQLKSVHKNGNNSRSKQTISQSLSIYEQWNKLSMEQQNKYCIEHYEDNLKKYTALYGKYISLTNKKPNINSLQKFYYGKYDTLERQKKFDEVEIQEMIEGKWAGMSRIEKCHLQPDSSVAKQEAYSLEQGQQERIRAYKAEFMLYQKSLELEKMQISERYELLPIHINQIQRLLVSEKLFKKYEKKQQKVRNKAKMAKLKEQRMSENLKKLEELKDRQIFQLQLQKYELMGCPREIFIIPNGFKEKTKEIKEPNTATTKQSRDRSASISDCESDEQSIQNYQKQANQVGRKTKKAKKSKFETQKVRTAVSLFQQT